MKLFELNTSNIIKEVYQFKITLMGSKPSIWRRKQIPSTYTFWDFHVAITDAMGWLDYHLHIFEMKDPKTYGKIEVGIPDEEDEAFDRIILPDFKKRISKYFYEHNKTATYEYDFGDSWRHKILFEKIIEAGPKEKYPKCISGKLACPPEDCGGIGGYYNLLEIINDPSHEDYEDMLEWLGGEFDPELFNPNNVPFDDPKERFNLMYKE